MKSMKNHQQYFILEKMLRFIGLNESIFLFSLLKKELSEVKSLRKFDESLTDNVYQSTSVFSMVLVTKMTVKIVWDQK